MNYTENRRTIAKNTIIHKNNMFNSPKVTSTLCAIETTPHFGNGKKPPFLSLEFDGGGGVEVTTGSPS